jgi:rhomboid family GlyGly-CTERM serine protease
MTTTTDGAGRCRTLAGENTPPAPFVVRWRRFAPPLALIFVILALHLIPHASSLLEFDRAALAHGELWRIFTGHFVHFDTSHLVWDTGAFALLAWLLPARSPRRWFVHVVGAALFISAGVWLLQPRFEIYRGLSGVDCALFGALLVERLRAARRERDRLALAIVALAATGFVAKSGIELLRDAPVFAAAGAYSPVPLAHLLGAIWGAFVAGTPCRVSPFPSSRKRHPNSRPADARACNGSARS